MKRSNESGNERRFTRYASRLTGVEHDRWLQVAVRALARRDRTTAQISTLLSAKGASPSQVRSVVRRLTSLKYLDDAAFAGRWADRRLARMPMGRARLQEELLATGCPDQVVKAALETAYRKMNERDLAMQVVTSIGTMNSPRMLGRATRLLSQRGFGEDTIETVLGMRNEE